jgi:hypothetical protein
LKKESAERDREIIIDFRRIKRPPKERKRLFHPDNIFLMRVATRYQKPRRLGSPPIGRPR